MIVIAVFPSSDDAEKAGEQLIAEGITPQLLGGRGGVTMVVRDEDADRARKILDLSTEVLAEQPAPFHPCPNCGAADPIWFGKRKLLLLIALTAGLVLLRASTAFPYAAVAAALVFLAAVRLVPEFQCRNCGFRWSKDRR
jgi:predicted RNA-binding Zn-ribbon protein involved in translation (DUF1610 family)